MKCIVIQYAQNENSKVDHFIPYNLNFPILPTKIGCVQVVLLFINITIMHEYWWTGFECCSTGVWAVAHTKISGVHYFKNVVFKQK